VIFFARYEALCQDAFAISAAHILIGLTREVGSRADVIASLKENEAKLREILAIPCPQTKLTEPKLSREIPWMINPRWYWNMLLGNPKAMTHIGSAQTTFFVAF